MYGTLELSCSLCDYRISSQMELEWSVLHIFTYSNFLKRISSPSVKQIKISLDQAYLWNKIFA